MPVYAQVQWQRSIGGTQGDFGQDIRQTVDGGYILAGFSYSSDGDATLNHGEADEWIIKLSPTGTIEWQKSYGGSADDYANSIQQTPDGGFITAGGTSSADGDVTSTYGNGDAWIVKLSATGVLQWQKNIGGTDIDYANCIRKTRDGGYIVAGKTLSSNGDVTGAHGGADAWIIKLSAAGDIEWQKAIGGSLDDEAKAIEQTPDDGYIFTGWSNSNDGDVSGHHGSVAYPSPDMWVVKLSASGDMQWQRSLGGSYDDRGLSVAATFDGGYILSGYCNSSDGDVTGHCAGHAGPVAGEAGGRWHYAVEHMP